MNNHKKHHFLTDNKSRVSKHKELAWVNDLFKYMVLLEVILIVLICKLNSKQYINLHK